MVAPFEVRMGRSTHRRAPEGCIRSVVITGTSGGIGWGTAKVLIANGFRVFGSVRKISDTERLAAEFGERFVPLLFDVTDEAAVPMRRR